MTSIRVSRWLELARNAPSGGNAQPWAIEYEEFDDEVAVRLFINPEYQKHPSPMDAKGVASALALGCFAKNLTIVANIDGYVLCNQSWEKQDNLLKCSALLLFKQGTALENKFSVQDVQLRRTDRYKYKKNTIPKSLMKSIQTILNKYPKISYVEVSQGNSELIQELSELEKIRWQNKFLLQGMLTEIGFNENLHDKIPSTHLGISFLDQIILKLICRFFKIGYLLVRFGLYKIVIKKSILLFVNHCDRVIFLQTKNIDFASCYEFGCCFQEIWLESNKHHVSFQPNGNTMIALSYWQNENTVNFSKAHQNILQKTTENFKRLFQIDLKSPVISFRLGYPEEKALQSPRKILIGWLRKGLIDQLKKKKSA